MQAVISEHYGMLSQFLPVVNHGGLEATLAARTSVTSSFSVLIMVGSVPLARLLATGLLAESLSVEVTHDLDSMMKRLDDSTPDLAILDIDLPDMDGAHLLAKLRDSQPELRILALSGQQGVEGLITALDHGADDYLPKPFSLLELVARVRVLRRRSQATVVAAPRKTSVVLHRDQCQVERDGRLIDLTPRELRLLEYLMENAGKTLSRALLTQEVWNMPAEGNTNIVDVYIKYLRDKLDGDHDIKVIRTIRGIGYSFQAQS
jgi:DNA-binding response OmpR family regulator